MTTIEQLHAYATALLTKKLKKASQLKDKITNNLRIVDDATNREIYELWDELEGIYNKNGVDNKEKKEEAKEIIINNDNKNKNANINNNDNNNNNKNIINKKRRGRKRKYDNTDSSDIDDKEPPRKRHKLSINTKIKTTDSNSSKHCNFRGRASTSSSISSSAKKHRRLTMRTTINNHEQSRNHLINTNNDNRNIDNDEDDDDEYLDKMLKNAEKAEELTDKNMDIIQQCIDSIEQFQDILEGDILEFGDEIRKTFQEFPFKTIIPSYHQKILQEQLRFNRILAKYPDLSQTESDIYKLQSNYISQYNTNNTERDNELESDGIGINNKKKNDDEDEEEESEQEEEEESDDDDEDEEEEEEEEEEEDILVNPRNNNLIDSDHEDNRWCLCEKPSNGNMIRCDNTLCLIQWFHWKCVRIMKVPKDKWYCKSCRKYPTKSNLLHAKFMKDTKKKKK